MENEIAKLDGMTGEYKPICEHTAVHVAIRHTKEMFQVVLISDLLPGKQPHMTAVITMPPSTARALRDALIRDIEKFDAQTGSAGNAAGNPAGTGGLFGRGK